MTSTEETDNTDNTENTEKARPKAPTDCPADPLRRSAGRQAGMFPSPMPVSRTVSSNRWAGTGEPPRGYFATEPL